MGCGVEPRVELALRRTLFFGLILLVYLIFGASIFSALPKRQQTLVSFLKILLFNILSDN